MTVLELERTERIAGKSAATLKVEIDGKAYLMIAGSSYMTVIAGQSWIDAGPRRSMGRTFHALADLRNHYKRHGAILAELCGDFGPWKNSAE